MCKSFILKEKQKDKGMFFRKYLDDDDIKTHIADTSISLIPPFIFYTLIVVIVSIALMCIPDENWREALSWICGVGAMVVLFKAVCAQVNKADRIKQSLINEHLKATLSYGTYCKVSQNWFESRHHIHYYVHFKDACGGKHKRAVTKDEYNRIKESYKPRQRVVVLKYPKHQGRGYAYDAFDAATLQNHSSISIRSWNDEDFN